MRRLTALLLLVIMAMTVLMPAYAETFTLAGHEPDNSYASWAENNFFARMTERTGVSFTMTQYMDEAEWNRVKAGYTRETIPDVLFKANLTDAECQAMYADGLIIDLLPLLPEHAPNLWAMLQAHPDYLAAITQPDGTVTALPFINEQPFNNTMWINTAWLETLGLSVPTTADEFTQVLRAFQQLDPNRNAGNDEIPMTFHGMWDLRFLGHAFGLVSNDYYLYTDAAGAICTDLDSDANRAFLTWLHQLWVENLIDHNGFGSLDYARRVTDTKATIPYGVLLSPTPLMLLPTTDNYSVLVPLQYEGKQTYRRLISDLNTGTFAISTACSDPAAVLRWVDYLYTEEGAWLAGVGERDIDYTVAADQTWYFLASDEEAARVILHTSTIHSGTPAPGWYPLSIQLAYSDEGATRLVKEIDAVQAFNVDPVPYKPMTTAERAELDTIQLELGTYADTAMARFVTGDVPLNDETWAEFCAGIHERGIDRVIEIHTGIQTR